MDRELTSFISKHRNLDRETHYTHVSCIRPKGRYVLSRSDLEAFWNLYNQRLQNNPDLVCGLAEIPQEHAMLVVDADIKKKCVDVAKDHPEIKVTYREGDDLKTKYTPIRLYTNDHVQKVISAYQSVLQTVTQNHSSKHDLCILLEKDPYISDDNIKSGFHLAFINYFCSKPMQDTYLIPRVITKVNEANIFKDIGFSVSSDILDITKKHMDAKPWLLYGARKSENASTYKVSKAYTSQGKEISLQEAFQGYQLYDTFEQELKYRTIEEVYPRVFSVNPTFRKTVEIIPIFDTSANVTFSEGKEKREDIKYDETYEQQMSTAKELVEMLSVERSEARDEWAEIGWILYSISKGSEEGLQLWITFSQQCQDKFSLEGCISEWSKMYVGNYTIGSLKHYAKIDSPEDYETFWKKRLEKMISKAVDGSHTSLAKVLYESYSTEYVCASLKPEMWFHYNNHHWEQMEEGVELRKKISDDLVHRYSSLIKDEFDNLAEMEDEDNDSKKQSDMRITGIYKLIKNLKTNSFKNSVMKECRDAFYDPMFLRRLGKNKYLVALKNGVYDLKNFVFRDGKPEDYIALQMPIAFREFNELDPWIIETQTFFDKVFPDNSIRFYVLDRCAELLIGGNKRKHLFFWTGRGNNGKSVMKSLIQRMFGQYFIDIPNAVLVGDKPKSGQACPELARSDKGVRVAFTQEPNKKDKVNTGAAKEYSGNDTFYARTLFEKGGEIDPLFKLIMIANDLPGVTTNDPAYWARVRVIPFESTFTDNPPSDEDEQIRTKTFLKDDNFEEKIDFMLEPLFWMLIQRLPNIKRVITEPPKVREAIDKYRRSQDVYAQFIDERIIPDDQKTIAVSDMYVAFRDWYKMSFPHTSIPNRNDFIDYMEDVWGTLTNYRWKGYRIRTEKDDVEAGLAEEVTSTSWDLNNSNPLVSN